MLKPPKSPRFSLRPGPLWLSFEKFRLEGNDGLAAIKDGVVGLLQSKSGRYRIVEEDDFQRLVAQTQQVESTQQNLRMLHLIAQEALGRRDEASFRLLRETLLTLERPPQTEASTALYTELGHPLDPDDEVELDPTRIRSPVKP